jgi:hypothetical protein
MLNAASGQGSPQPLMPPLTAAAPTLAADAAGYIFASNAAGIAYAATEIPSAIHFKPLNFSWQPVLIFDLPEGVELLSALRAIRILAPEPVTRNGARYQRYTIIPEKNASKFTFFWRTTLAPGTKLTGYYHARWDKGSQAEQSLPIEIISIPKGQTFRELPVWLSIPSDMADIWPGLDNYRKAGFNTLDIWSYARANERVWGGKQLTSVAAKALRSNIRLIAGTREWWWEEAGRDPEAQAVTLSGQRVKVVCPTYRGKHFEAFCEQGRYLIDNGLYFHSVDPEIYRDAGAICYCDRCRDGFRKYLAANYPGRPTADPLVFMKSPEKFPEEVKLWNRFKGAAFAGIYGDYRREMEAYLQRKGIREKFRLMVYSTYHRAWGSFYGYADYEKATPYLKTMEDPKALAEVFDYISPMVYPDLYARGKEYNMTGPWKDTVSLTRIVGNKTTVAPLLSAGYPFIEPYNVDNSPEMIRYNMLEAIAGGARGLGFWGVCPLDAADMRSIAETVQMLVPAEEVILSGEPFEDPKEGNVFVKGIKSRDRALVLVSEYSRRPVEARVKSPLPCPDCTVTDLATGKTIPSDGSGFLVQLTQIRARIFLVTRK